MYHYTRAAEEFNDALGRLDARVQGLTVSIGLPLVRGLTDVLQMFQEVEAAVIRAMKEMEGFSKHLSQNFGNSGVGQRLMDVFSAMGFGHRKGEAPGEAEQFLQGVLGFKSGGSGESGRDVSLAVTKPQIPSSGGKDATAHAKEQEALGRALLDIYKSQNTALDIRNKLNGGQGQMSEFFLAFDRQQQFRREDEAEQERMGKLIVANTQREVLATAEKQAMERDGLVKNLQAWIDYDNAVGASTELRYQHQVDLLKANLAQQIDITTDEAGRLLDAWKTVDNVASDSILNQTRLTVQQRETLELQSLSKLQQIHEQTSQNIFDGWARGLQRYVQDTQSGFGLGADLARRTAQTMEQNFRTFFFDAFEGKIRSLKDVFQSFGNFVKQIMAQVAAQLATMLVLKGVTGGFGSFGLGGLFGGSGGGGSVDAGGLMGLKFASGGPVLGAGNQDSVRAMLTPGEGVLNRKGMQALAQLNSGTAASSASPNVVINFHGMPAGERPQINYRRQFEGLVVDVILRNRDLQAALGLAR